MNNQNPKLRFAINWNLKLTNIVFSTIRLQNDDKFKLGGLCDVVCEDNLHHNSSGVAEIIYIKHFLLTEITEPLFLLDMALNKADGIKMIKHLYANKIEAGLDIENAPFSFMLLQWKPQYLDIYYNQFQLGINQILTA